MQWPIFKIICFKAKNRFLLSSWKVEFLKVHGLHRTSTTVMDFWIGELLCCWYITWHPLLRSLIRQGKYVFLFIKKVVQTTCLLNGRRQRITAINQKNRQQYVSVHTEKNSQWSSSSYCWTTWEMYKQGAFDQITNTIQMSQMLSSQFLFGIKQTLWLLSVVCLQQSPQETRPHA